MNMRDLIRLFTLLIGGLVGNANAGVILPYDRTSPVIYDNDSQGDVYSEALVLALASSGDIVLKGMIATSIIDSPNTPASYDNAVNFNNASIASAKSSGFRNIPVSVTKGVRGRLQKPTNGQIDSTSPMWTDGGKLIVSEARKCSYAKPLVVVVGGPSSTVVDAYLQDKSIADKLVMVWINGAGAGYNRLGEDYNGWADTWALYIAANRLRIVSIPFGGGQVPKSRILSDLPNKPFRTFMYNQSFTAADGSIYPGGWDGDGSIVDGLVYRDWLLSSKKVSFLDMNGSVWGRNIARTYDNVNGNILLITSVNFAAQTSDWWKGMTNPKAWDAASIGPPVVAKTPPSLMMSSAPDRSAAVALQGAVPTDDIYVFAKTDSTASRVEFWLDDPTPAKPGNAPRQTENAGPYDFAGTATDRSALPLDISALSSGAHTISVRVTLQDGTVQPVVTASFTINQTNLYVSSASDRSNARLLQGYSTGANASLYVFAAPETDIARVMFWLDDPTPSNPSGVPVKTENLPPYDLAGSASVSTALPFNTSWIGKGTHQLTIRATKNDGTVSPPVTASFTRW